MTRQQITDKISEHIRYAFDELGRKRSSNVNLDKAVIIAHYLSDIGQYPELMGFNVIVTDLQSSYDYYIAIYGANSDEEKWLKLHREATETLAMSSEE
jgi:hypothetical protein